MPQGGARGQNLGHLRFFFAFIVIVCNHSILTTGTVRVFLSVTFDRMVQWSRVGLEVNIYDTPAGVIRASQGTFSSSI